MDHGDACGLKDGITGWGELGVVVMDQTAEDRLPFFQAPRDLSGLLGHPAGIRIACTASEVNLSAAQLNEEKHIHRLQK